MESETPILDLQLPWPVNSAGLKLKRWHRIALGILILSAIPIGIVAALYFPSVLFAIEPLTKPVNVFVKFVIAPVLESREQSPIQVFLFVGVLVLSPILATLVHELGHILASKWVGFSVARLDVGPLVLERINSKWKFRVQRAWAVGGRVIPLFQVRPGHRRKLIKFFAAGPAASLL